ncbi:Tumor necrosis factor receptor type 1-associated DEATH domain protein [Bagarius yarrelli]|uniref:Tumor necrosis factor receptor type 1-associated DEATH domain protein n=1 Tax=Bagarius yarrelli TaxID=175774 RepID=A0A556VCN4_BAGYA|nr:Tumor necrosis factor receptor type 1-associated DEATH domain protein [Bagarius yarrelli]
MKVLIFCSSHVCSVSLSAEQRSLECSENGQDHRYIDVAGGINGYEILKLHDADPFLGVELKFMDIVPCRRFIDSYKSGSLLQSLSQHASRLLSLPDAAAMMFMLKAGTHTLDHSLQDPDLCLQLIQQSRPVRLRDDEVTQLEQQLQNCCIPPVPTIKEVPKNCFLFQKRLFHDRSLTPADQQRFASHVGREWKQVGRALQKSCRALKGTAIDNLAYEYEREGLYEQAYQLLGRFIQSEGRNAKLGRLIGALEEAKLLLPQGLTYFHSTNRDEPDVSGDAADPAARRLPKWPFHMTGFSGLQHTSEMEAKDDFAENPGVTAPMRRPGRAGWHHR